MNGLVGLDKPFKSPATRPLRLAIRTDPLIRLNKSIRFVKKSAYRFNLRSLILSNCSNDSDRIFSPNRVTTVLAVKLSRLVRLKQEICKLSTGNVL